MLREVDLKKRAITVMGKGSKERSIPIGSKTVRDLDRYIRVRDRHKDADVPWLWLGPKGRFTDSGIYQMLARRCKEAGLERVNPHRFRHTFSHLWLVEGGTEHALAAINGWNSTQMVGRYAKSAQVERAHAAHRKLSPRNRF